ncbi:uncharacterized protein LOC101852625 [Aplysia californica]|uniref:Uncharacterized protein LOC101852625 n=1 Tax=Aplysia californica TaxID=6500 RepID=A0ABM0ZZZ1_APLCA|nr:uncharacterized protein LOC101852625 [Aplysia californica]
MCLVPRDQYTCVLSHVTNIYVSCPTADCVSQGTCQCPEGEQGDPELFCYLPGSQVLAVSGANSRLTGWTNQRDADLVLPGRLRLTGFTTQQLSSDHLCHFQIFGETRMYQNRLLLVGMEVNFRRTGGDLEQDWVATRVRWEIMAGENTIIEWGRIYFYETPADSDVQDTEESDSDLSAGSGSGDSDSTFTDTETDDVTPAWGPPVQLDLGGGQTAAWVLDTDNFARLSLADCSTDVIFRSPLVADFQLTREAGMGVVLSPQADGVTFTSSEQYLGSRLTTYGDLSDQQILLHTGLEYPGLQDSNTTTGQLHTSTASSYRDLCFDLEKQTRAMQDCGLVLGQQVVECLLTDDQEDNLKPLKLFKSCIECACPKLSDVCFSVPEQPECQELVQ